MVGTRKHNYDKIQQQGKDGGIAAKSFVYVRRIPVETWLQVLCWIRRTELGLRVSMACRSLRSLSHIRLFEKCKYLPGNNERSMGSIKIKKIGTSSPDIALLGPNATILNINGHTLDFPDFVPENIVRFDKIEISHVDEKALIFLRNISRIFVAVNLNVVDGDCMQLGPRRKSILHHILPLCTSIQSLYCLSKFLCEIWVNSPTLLAQCQILNIVCLLQEEAFTDVLALLLQWLRIGRADGRPKVAGFYIGEQHLLQQLIRSLEKQFVDASAPSPFIVRIIFYEEDGLNAVEHPPMQNSATGEQFSLQIDFQYGTGVALITRYALRMPQTVQQELDEWKQKLISGNDIDVQIPDEQMIQIY